MHHHHRDILSRIAEPPRWFDENGVPRFDDFDPDTMANIYAKECVLMVIRCQACGVAFEVALDARAAFQNLPSPETSGFQALAKIIRSGELHDGDPPNVGCCSAGPAMNSDRSGSCSTGAGSGRNVSIRRPEGPSPGSWSGSAIRAWRGTSCCLGFAPAGCRQAGLVAVPPAAKPDDGQRPR